MKNMIIEMVRSIAMRRTLWLFFFVIISGCASNLRCGKDYFEWENVKDAESAGRVIAELCRYTHDSVSSE